MFQGDFNLIQILALRPYTKDGQTRIAEKWFTEGIRSPSVDMLLADPFTTVDQIKRQLGVDQTWNVYYTVCECLEEPGRKFQSQSHIPFDIDGLDLPQDTSVPLAQVELVARAVCDAIGVQYGDVGVVFSGNGLQFLIGLDKPIEDVGFFDEARLHYKAICEKIDLKLSQMNIRGKADPSVWSPARLLRHPETYNRKANKPERKSFVLQATIKRSDFRLEKASGIPTVAAGDHLNPEAARQLFNADPEAILQKDIGCDFMKFCKTSPEKVSELWWYASLSITERFPDAAKWSHEFSKGHPKYTYGETELKRRQAVAASGPRTCKNIEGLGWDCQTCPQFGKIHSPITIEGANSIKTLNTGFYFQKKDAHGNPVKGQPDYPGLWKYFCRTHDYVSVSDTPEIYAFKETHWESVSRDEVMSFAQRSFKPPPMKRERDEFYSFVKISNLVKRNHFEETQEGLFNFSNGVYSILDQKLFPHDKKYPFRHTLPCDHDSSATAPKFTQFLKEVTGERQELINILQEFMGYVIAGGPCIHHSALTLLGDGANGKSTFVEVLRALVGTAASSLSIKDLNDPQKLLAVDGKILNIAEENSKDSFNDTALIKNMIGGGKVWAKQLYSQPFEFRNRAKFILLMNELPRNYDHSNGFYRRLLIVPFDAKFNKHTGVDKGMAVKLIEELPGIFNFALEGYLRLQTQGDFTESKISQELVDDYSLESDHIQGWLKDETRILVSEGVKTLKTSLYKSYKAYCEENGVYRVEASNRFFPRLKTLFKQMNVSWKESRPRGDDSRQRFLQYIELRGPDAMTLHIDATHAQVYRPSD